MKTFDELTKKEISLLTEDQIKFYVEFELMKNKVVEVPAPEFSEENLPIKETVWMYSCSGILFSTAEEARKFSEMSLYKEDYNYNIGYKYKYPTLVEDKSISEIKLFSIDDVNKWSAELKDITSRKGKYDAAKTAYNSYLSKYNEIKSGIETEICEAKSFYRSVDFAKAQLDKYIVLSGGDRSVAVNFFKENFPEEIVNEVLNNTSEAVES